MENNIENKAYLQVGVMRLMDVKILLDSNKIIVENAYKDITTYDENQKL